MKKLHLLVIALSVICSFVCFRVVAQEDPQYSHYMFNRLTYNPAVAGSQEYINVTLLLRNQWLGLTEGTPVTQNLLAHMPLTTRGKKVNHGLGLHIVNDLIGAEVQTEVMISYALRVNTGFGNLAFGINGGITQTSLDGGELRAPDGTYEGGIDHGGDPLIPVDKVSGINPDFNLGVYFTRKDLFAGISTTHLIEPSVDLQAYKVEQVRHYYFNIGYNYRVSKKIDLTPTVLIKSDLTKTQIDLNTLIFYNKNLWTGVSFRGITSDNNDALVALIGLNLTEQLRLGYSYDITLSDLRTFSSGTHEFMLNHIFRLSPPGKPARIIHCPRFL